MGTHPCSTTTSPRGWACNCSPDGSTRCSQISKRVPAHSGGSRRQYIEHLIANQTVYDEYDAWLSDLKCHLERRRRAKLVSTKSIVGTSRPRMFCSKALAMARSRRIRDMRTTPVIQALAPSSARSVDELTSTRWRGQLQAPWARAPHVLRCSARRRTVGQLTSTWHGSPVKERRYW